MARSIVECQIFSGLHLLESCKDLGLSTQFREAIALFIAGALPEHFKSVARQWEGDLIARVKDITLQHLCLLGWSDLEHLRDFVFIHIALSFPMLPEWRVALSRFADPVSVRPLISASEHVKQIVMWNVRGVTPLFLCIDCTLSILVLSFGNVRCTVIAQWLCFSIYDYATT